MCDARFLEVEKALPQVVHSKLSKLLVPAEPSVPPLVEDCSHPRLRPTIVVENVEEASIAEGIRAVKTARERATRLAQASPRPAEAKPRETCTGLRREVRQGTSLSGIVGTKGRFVDCGRGDERSNLHRPWCIQKDSPRPDVTDSPRRG
jgi:hypothetical protein